MGGNEREGKRTERERYALVGLNPADLETFHTAPPLREVKVAPLRDTPAPVAATVSARWLAFRDCTGFE
jgi:hypothetical protein